MWVALPILECNGLYKIVLVSHPAASYNGAQWLLSYTKVQVSPGKV